ncbi:MAG TPA: DinB family protein [Gemmatimonadaceae bacterium]|nr:DinB family protein [Gemmatimonadaceae bacterium]
MHPRIAELLEHIDTQSRVLQQAVESVPAARRDDSPGPDRWSVAGVLEHLAIIEARVSGLLRSRMAAARASGVGEETETSPILDTSKLAVFLDRNRKIQTGDAAKPTGIRADAAWTALEAARNGFRDAVVEADGFALGGVMQPHPAFGPINLYEWIAFTASHEARHALQIREIGEQLATSAAS